MFKKRFIAKKRVPFFKIKLFLWLIVVILAFWVTFSLIFRSHFKNILSNKTFQESTINFGLGKWNFGSINLMSPKEILHFGLNYAFKEAEKKEVPKDLIAYDETPNDLMPRVYIYNTHENEGYDSPMLEAYNISYTVKTASYILKDYLRDLGIPTYVEKESVTKYLKDNNLNYNYSYRASRYYLEERKKEYPSLEFFIDLHRDSVPASVTRGTIEGVSYAKVMFVVGVDYPGYEEKLTLAETLNSKLDKNISRGILKRNGAGTTGIYNQEASKNVILIEVGGVDNTIEEVNNTLNVLAKIIFEYMNGQ